MRLRPRSVLPSTASTGGSTVRSRKGLASLMRRTERPTTRVCSAARYATMSGSSDIAAERGAILAAPLAVVEGLVGLDQEVLGGGRIVRIDRPADRNREAQHF